jgi:hypothetical protein
MTVISECAGCGNSPKNRLLQELVIAMARADLGEIEALVSQEVRWLVPGNKPVVGAKAFCKAVTRHGPATRLALAHVVSHGRSGTVDGVVEFGGKSRAFCHVFEFGSAKGTDVKSITTYSSALK